MWKLIATLIAAAVGTGLVASRVSGAESPAPDKARQPKITILDVNPTSDAVDPGALGSLEDEPPTTKPTPSGATLLKPIPIPTESQPPVTAPTRHLPNAPQPRASVPPAQPDPVGDAPGVPQLIVPFPDAPAAAPAQPMTLPSARYWIASTRCCSQKKHKCGQSCRFVCHRVTDPCVMHSASPEEMFASLIPGAPTCVFVHGSYTRMEAVAEDAEFTFQWLRCACPQAPLNFIYFTWPSEGQCSPIQDNPFLTPIPSVDIAILGRRAEWNGFYLADLVGCLPPHSNVCLLGHSLGTRTIVSALHLLGGGTVRDQARWNPVDGGQRIHVVLAAAAIEHDWLNPGDRYGCALRRTECLLNLRNEKDLALLFFPLRHPFASRSLARAGFTRKDHRKLGEHNCRVAELDVTRWLKHHHSWPEYVERPQVAAAIAPYVYFEHYGAMPPAGAVSLPSTESVPEYVPSR